MHEFRKLCELRESRGIGWRGIGAALVLLALVAMPASAATLADEIAPLVGADGVAYAVAEDGSVLVDIRGDVPFVPASTIKVVTCLIALEELGADYRFKTEIFAAGDVLVVRGGGDPLLVSEELERIARALAPRVAGTYFAGVAIDDSYFGSGIRIPGVGGSDNPYDALNSATAVNFNTINVKREGGRIVSAERQTPLTPTAAALAARHTIRGETRLRLGDRAGDLQRYAGEMFAAKLQNAGVQVSSRVTESRAPEVEPIYVHASSKPLTEACRMMLRYSNNYIANQIFLVLGAHELGEPASLQKAAAVAARFVARNPKLHGLRLIEGSGISRENAATAEALAEALAMFAPYRSLLHVERASQHKTGSLRTVRSLVGYLETKKHGLVRYVIALDGSGHTRRWSIVDMLAAAL